MYAVKVVEQAAPRRLFAEMRHPYTDALFESIPKLGLPSHTKLEAISGRPPDLVNPPVGCRFAARCKYAQPRCFEEEPTLLQQGDTPGHWAACRFPVGTPEAAEALARNQAAGVGPLDAKAGA